LFVNLLQRYKIIKNWQLKFKNNFVTLSAKRERYGTELEQEPEIVLLHQGGSRDVWSEREYPALLGNGVSVSKAQSFWTVKDSPVSGEGHRTDSPDS
jgi:hypothetical protein